MTREEAKEMLPIIQAYAEGKKIEYSTNGKSWLETENPIWDNYFTYRVNPEPKFDPKTLNPFDKVLVRTEGYNLWSVDLFSFISDRDFKCVGGYFKRCIPYNVKTKHLIGTCDEAPEFYRYWED